MSRGGRVLGQIALVGAGLAIAIIATELVVRAVGRVPIVPQMYVEDPHTMYRHKPVARERAVWRGVFDWTWSVNAQGFRGTREYEVPKPAGRRRVIALGDSFTFGFGVSDADAYPARLQLALADACAGVDAEVVNAGVSAFGTSQSLALLEHYGAALAPDVVLYGFFVNDPQDNLDKAVHELVEGRLIERDLASAPEAYAQSSRAKRLVNAIPGYDWLVRRSALLNWMRQTYFRLRTPSGPARWGQDAPSPTAAPDTLDDARMWEMMAALLETMRQRSTELGAAFVVALLPSQDEVEQYRAGQAAAAEPFVRMGELCDRLSLTCVDVAAWIVEHEPTLDPAALYIPHEGHFSERGNEVAARAVLGATSRALGCAGTSTVRDGARTVLVGHGLAGRRGGG